MTPPSESARAVPAAFGLRVDDNTRLVLPTHDLVTAIFELERREQPQLARWEPWAAEPPSAASTAARLKRAMVDFAEGHRVPTYVEWHGAVVGSVNARIDEWSSAAELGYYLAVHAQGVGIVTRCATVLIEHLMVHTGVDRIYIQTAVDNVAGRSVAERLGLKMEGTLRSAWSVQGARVDATLHGMTRGDWLAQRRDPG